MQLFIPGPAGPLEAVYWPATRADAPPAAAVMCHPHPLFGGTMNNNVVFRAARGLQQAGLAVLRFNFRGAGRSAGAHDGQGAETGDVGAALDWLAERHPGIELWAGGFSFGARTAAQRALADERVRKVVLVALPVLAFDCAFVRGLRQPTFVLMAERDEFGTLSDLRRLHPGLGPNVETEEVPGVGHFFEGATPEVTARVAAWAERHLERAT